MEFDLVKLELKYHFFFFVLDACITSLKVNIKDGVICLSQGSKNPPTAGGKLSGLQ